jgi:hypothetical protein
MNAISKTVAAVRPSLGSPASIAELARARGVHAALAPYATPEAVLDALAEESPLGDAERDAIVLAILIEQRRTRHPLWQALLLVTYAPMLHRVARRTLGVDRDDARQGALAGFLEAIAKVRIDPPPMLLSLTLRHATERTAFAASTLVDEPQVEPLESARHEPDPSDVHETIEREDQMRRVVEELVGLFGERDAREVLEVLLVARTSRVALLEHVEATYPGLTAAKKSAMYTRLQRMRARALAHLAETFGGDLDPEIEIAVA